MSDIASVLTTARHGVDTVNRDLADLSVNRDRSAYDDMNTINSDVDKLIDIVQNLNDALDTLLDAIDVNSGQN